MIKVVFFTAKDTAAKLRKIARAAQDHLERKDPLLILAPDNAAKEFLDALLWKLPEESFLPHPSKLIQIDLHPHEGGPALFNLRPIAYLEKHLFQTIYELEDHTSAEKLQLSRQRYESYKEAGIPISLLTD